MAVSVVGPSVREIAVDEKGAGTSGGKRGPLLAGAAHVESLVPDQRIFQKVRPGYKSNHIDDVHVPFLNEIHNGIPIQFRVGRLGEFCIID